MREDPETVVAIRKHLRPMSEPELGYFFVAETDLLREAAPEQRVHVQECYLACDQVLLA